MRIAQGSKTRLLTQELGSGGQATVYAYPGDDSLAVKVYKDATSFEPARLEYQLDNPPSPLIENGTPTFSWPLEMVHCASTGRPIGFLMPRVTSVVPLAQIWNPTTRISQIEKRWLLQVAISFIFRPYALHWAGYLRGDISGTNDLVNRHGQVTAIDVDSTQFRDGHDVLFRANWGRPEFQPPELIGSDAFRVERTKDADAWSAAVVVHMLLRSGEHPFNCRFLGQGTKPTLVERIRQGIWPDGNRHHEFGPPRGAPPFGSLPSELQALFRKTFEDGHRDPIARPGIVAYLQCLREIERAGNW